MTRTQREAVVGGGLMLFLAVATFLATYLPSDGLPLGLAVLAAVGIPAFGLIGARAVIAAIDWSQRADR